MPATRPATVAVCRPGIDGSAPSHQIETGGVTIIASANKCPAIVAVGTPCPKTLCVPQSLANPAKVGHTVERNAHCAAPAIFDLCVGKLRIDTEHVGRTNALMSLGSDWSSSRRRQKSSPSSDSFQ